MSNFMKRIFLLFYILVAGSATAQDYKPFKVNLSLGYAKALGRGLSGGALLALEPKYGVGDHFDVGFRLESSFIARGVTYNYRTTTGDVVAFSSYLFTGTYLFGSGTTRPFMGLGAGLFRIASSDLLTIVNDQLIQVVRVRFAGETKFGGMIRAGIKASHFVASVEYNAVPTTMLNVAVTTPLINTTLKSTNAYMGIKIGF